EVVAGGDACAVIDPDPFAVAHRNCVGITVFASLNRRTGVPGGEVSDLVRLAPQLFSSAGVETDQQVGFGGDEEALADQDGRRRAHADFGLQDVFFFGGPFRGGIGGGVLSAAAPAPADGGLDRVVR